MQHTTVAAHGAAIVHSSRLRSYYNASPKWNVIPCGIPNTTSRRRIQTAQCPVTCSALKVYEGRMPLAGFEILPSPLAKLVQIHSLIVIGDDSDPGQACLVADFLPLNPTSPVTAVQLFSSQSVPGELRLRRLPKFIKCPTVNTWSLDITMTAFASLEALEEHVHTFNRTYNSSLHLLSNNCYNYSTALVKHLSDASTSDTDSNVMAATASEATKVR